MARILAPGVTVEALGDLDPDNFLLRLYTLQPEAESTETWKRTRYRDLARATIDKDLLQNLHQRQSKLLDQFSGQHKMISDTVRLQTDSNFTCGLSHPTVLENGMTLLRPWGFPYLPSSAIKGRIASWLAELLVDDGINLPRDARDQALRNSDFHKVFGWAKPASEEGDPGHVLFLDALPESFTLETDITTVHLQAWHQERQPPLGVENPTPIPFLAVAGGSVFVFRFATRDDLSFDLASLYGAHAAKLEPFGLADAASLPEFLRLLLISTAHFCGFGAQTAVGYGRMRLAQ